MVVTCSLCGVTLCTDALLCVFTKVFFLIWCGMDVFVGVRGCYLILTIIITIIVPLILTFILTKILGWDWMGCDKMMMKIACIPWHIQVRLGCNNKIK